nr:squalene/phytoene synthase family protein [uncultured Cohaesibacter sp.]
MHASIDNFQFCEQELKKIDPIGHFSALTAHKQTRPSLMVLLAFIATIRRIPGQVSSIEMRQIRLQWWRENLTDNKASFSTGCGLANIGPLASSLKQVQKQFSLPDDLLIAFIDAYDISKVADSPTQDAYFEYSWNAYSIPLSLACQILIRDQNQDAFTSLLKSAGMAICLAEDLRNWPQQMQDQRKGLPLDLSSHQQQSTQETKKRNDHPSMQATMNELCDIALENNKHALTLLKDLKKNGFAEAIPAFLPLALVPKIIKARKKSPDEAIILSKWRSFLSIGYMAYRL